MSLAKLQVFASHADAHKNLLPGLAVRRSRNERLTTLRLTIL